MFFLGNNEPERVHLKEVIMARNKEHRGTARHLREKMERRRRRLGRRTAIAGIIAGRPSRLLRAIVARKGEIAGAAAVAAFGAVFGWLLVNTI